MDRQKSPPRERGMEPFKAGAQAQGKRQMWSMRAQGRGRRPVSGGKARGDSKSAGCRVMFIVTSKSLKLALIKSRTFS